MKYIVLKNELKSMAAELKSSKVVFKEKQRTDVNDGSTWILDTRIKKLKFEFRHKLIAYCLLRGLVYGNVERSCKEGNEPNWSYIEGVRNEYSL